MRSAPRPRTIHASLALGGAVACVLGGALAGCRADIADLDGAFYDGDGRLLHCAVNLDASAGNSLASFDGALDRAAERGEVVELYAHRPGTTVSLATIEHVLAGANARGLAYVTYAELAEGGGLGPGIALSFDDHAIGAWTSARALLQQYGARVTFFVSRYNTFSDEGRAQLRDLASDGHEIGAHSVLHLRAPAYVEEHGLQAYLDEEALPSIEILRGDGYTVTSYAYPFGARTEELDNALARHVSVLRSVKFPVHGPVNPCPR